MNLYVNNALNMPLGKLISQIAHAQCAVVLGCYDFEHKRFKVHPDTLYSALNTTHIEYVNVQNMQENIIRIVDQAHTVFDKPTLTTSIHLSDSEIDHLHFQHNEFEATESTDIRMILIAEKSFRKSMNKQVFIKQASLAYAYHLIQLLTFFDSLTQHQQHCLMQWSKGTFAKITLNATTEDIQQLRFVPYTYQISLLEGMLVLGPDSKDQFEVVNHLKLL